MKVAYVDDSSQDRSILQQYVTKLNETSETKIELKSFSNSYAFLEQYDCSYDILILDVEMTPLNGIELATEIRKVDSSVVILFLTNMAQYAINGYSVWAVDYILKPVKYAEFQIKMNRAFSFVDKDKHTKLLIQTPSKYLSIEIDQIRYIEVQGNNCIYHTNQGKHEVRSTLKEVETKLKGHCFFRMNYSYLANMKYVEEIQEYTAVVAGEKLQISRNRKKAFSAAQLRYWSGERNFV